ncbi:MAG: SBBP repeat-containing protein [Candidatus Hodarchaeota archaeon]
MKFNSMGVNARNLILSVFILIILTSNFQISLITFDFSWNEMNVNHKRISSSQLTEYPHALEWRKTWRIGTNINMGENWIVKRGDSAKAIKVSADGKFIYIGGSYGHCQTGVGYSSGASFLINIDNNANFIWSKIWGGGGRGGHSSAEGLVVDSFNNIYMVVSSIGGQMCEDNGAFILKYSNAGNLEFEVECLSSSEKGLDIALDSHNNIYVTGHSWGNMVLLKYDELGNYLWRKTFGEYDLYLGRAMAIDSLNNVYIAGSGWDYEKDMSYVALLKINSYGNYLWHRIWELGINKAPNDLIIDSSDHKIYVLGDNFLLNYHCNGNLIWNNTKIGGKAITLDLNDNLYIVGNDLFKYSSNGDQLWRIPECEGNTIAIDSQDNIYITGNSGSGIFLEKYGIDSDGDHLTDSHEKNIYFTDPNNPDSDDDNISDWDEANIDSDNDGLSNWQENHIYWTNSNDPDCDDDGLLDGEEFEISSTDPWDPDCDNDGLLDGEEINLYDTNPKMFDSDKDGLSDGEEIKIYNTNPNLPDSDNDTLTDWEEVNNTFTNPNSWDTDGDGFSDREEIESDTDPNVFFDNPFLSSLKPQIVLFFVIYSILFVIIIIATFLLLRKFFLKTR